MRRSFRWAPRPRVAVNRSLRVGSYTTACSTRPLTASAMLTQYTGKPWMKLVVPSSGSMIQTNGASLAPCLRPDSSARMPWSGEAVSSVSMTACSLAWSTSVTKSLICFCAIRTDSTSRAARLMMAPAARAALMATFSMGCRLDDINDDGGQGILQSKSAGGGVFPAMQAATISAILPVPPMKTRFVLINTSHAGNVGAVARAMKTMGFDDLVLVAPRWPNVLRHEETIQRASGALDLLRQARIVAGLDQALDGISHLCATAMTARDFGPPTTTPRAHFETLLKKEQPVHDSSAPAATRPTGVAFLFGSERFGMSNADVYRCHVALSIPTQPGFGSLNLGAAVQVIAYEWRMALDGCGLVVPDGTPAPPPPPRRPAPGRARGGGGGGGVGWCGRAPRRATWPMPCRWRACWSIGSRHSRRSAFWIPPRPKSSCRACSNCSTAHNWLPRKSTSCAVSPRPSSRRRRPTANAHPRQATKHECAPSRDEHGDSVSAPNT